MYILLHCSHPDCQDWIKVLPEEVPKYRAWGWRTLTEEENHERIL
jgi:hypothetical protein